MTVPKDHVVVKEQVLADIKKYKEL